jgi:cephalosporin-C deacetylase-like acetyl esterase
MTTLRPYQQSKSFNRREMLRVTSLSLAALWQANSLAAQDEQRQASVSPSTLMPLNRFPRMVQEYFVEQVRAVEDAGKKVRAELKTKADAESYIRDVRRKIHSCFGPFPEKTPLNARVTGKVERDAYRIENVIFESRPNFLVTANLYVPTNRQGRMPGVVGSCGHSDNGKAAATYQSFAQGLARMGYVCLLFDPIGQGERLQYGHLDAKSRPRIGVGEHLQAGNQQFLVGEFFGSWRAWDGIRALDYLLTRDEVDPKHIGITGNSGGGTMTTWLCGVEDRWTMAAPSCFVTTFRRNMENELPADTEQCPPRVLALGLDHADFLAAMAPKPVMILSQEMDYFDVRGAKEAFERLRNLYQLLGAEQNIQLFVGPRPHGYHQENREAMYRWFNRATGASQQDKEPQLQLEKDETLQCTPNGQVAELNSRSVFSFTREKAQSLSKKRPSLNDDDLSGAVAAAMKFPDRAEVSDFRILRPISGRNYPRPHATTYAVETDSGIHALVYRLAEQSHMSRPPQDIQRAVLYVAHHSSDAELRSEPLIGELLKQDAGSDFWTCDVRGIGESRPNTAGQNQFLAPYGNDYFYAIHALMLDHPYVAKKTFDLCRVLDWMKLLGRQEIHVAARGWGAIPATFAALLHDSVTQVTLKNYLTSYQAIAESEVHHWPLSSFMPGILDKFDLPDCYRVLKARKNLQLIDPWGPEADG